MGHWKLLQRAELAGLRLTRWSFGTGGPHYLHPFCKGCESHGYLHTCSEMQDTITGLSVTSIISLQSKV